MKDDKAIAQARERPPSVVETHTSIVVLVGDRAYKIKKPVSFGFLDFTDPETRRVACHRELELNGRLSPDVYLGVLDIVNSEGVAEDHVVVMKRLPEHRQLNRMIEEGEGVIGPLRSVAKAMATLHGSPMSEPSGDFTADPRNPFDRWEENISELLELPTLAAFVEDIESVDQLARQFVDGRQPLFEERIKLGAIRDGHGDLRCDSVYCLDDGPRIVDCLDFSDQLRTMDVACDTAFLCADLEFLGRGELGHEFLSAYREYSGDHWPESLTHFYVAYWAAVRAKVSAIREAQLGDGEPYDAIRWIEISRKNLLKAMVNIVLVGGSPGTGKSSLAETIADERDWLVLRSDDVRHDVLGKDRNEHLPADYRSNSYSPAVTATTYDELLNRARNIVTNGESVILDATWMEDSRRVAARELAESTRSRIVELQCVVADDIASERIIERQSLSRDPSDATVEIAHRINEDFEPWPTAWIVDTSNSLADSAHIALDLITGDWSG